MNRFLVFIIISLASSSLLTAQQPGWFLLRPPLPDTLLTGIAFSSPETGHLTGGTFGARRTADGGRTWSPIALASGLTPNMILMYSAISFPTPQVGYIAVRYTYIANNQSVTANGIIRTTDGGLTWGLRAPDSVTVGIGLQFLSADTGFAIGPYSLMKTVDGGMTWRNLNMPVPHPSSGNSSCQWMDFRDELHGMAIVYSTGPEPSFWYDLLSTTDGGITWKNITKRPAGTDGGSGECITHLDGRTWLVVGTSSLKDMNISRSTDDGSNWDTIRLTAPQRTTGSPRFGFYQNKIGYVTGALSTVFRTTDAGISWTAQSMPDNYTNTGPVAVTSENVTYLIGTQIGKLSAGMLLKTENGGGTLDVGDRSDGQSGSLTIVPSPAVGPVQVMFAAATGERTMTIRNILGVAVATQSIPPGTTRAGVAMDNMAAGMYFCTLGNQTMKFMLMDH